jgi:hypothetical protein
LFYLAIAYYCFWTSIRRINPDWPIRFSLVLVGVAFLVGPLIFLYVIIRMMLKRRYRPTVAFFLTMDA